MLLDQIDRIAEVMHHYVAAGTVSAVANVVAALGTLYIMQAITWNAGFTSGLAFLHLLHRLGHAALSLAFIVNAVTTVVHDSVPRPVDVIVYVVFAVVTIIAVVRLIVMSRDKPLPPYAPPPQA